MDANGNPLEANEENLIDFGEAPLLQQQQQPPLLHQQQQPPLLQQQQQPPLLQQQQQPPLLQQQQQALRRDLPPNPANLVNVRRNRKGVPRRLQALAEEVVHKNSDGEDLPESSKKRRGSSSSSE